jgi:hypothetical protein
MKFLTLILIFTSFAMLSSCKKKGCTDIDADNYDSSAEKSSVCKFRYGNNVTVYTPNSVNYDPLDAPDLYVRFAKSSSSSWDYNTTIGSNSNSLTANFTDFLFGNEQWDFEVYDYDTLDADDLVCSGTFNPLTDGKDGEIKILTSGCTVTFKYSVQ